MRREDIRDLTRSTPFRPFRVYLTSCETFDIHHPDMIVATPGSAHIAVPGPAGPPDAAEHVVIVSLVHIQKVQYIPQSPSAHPGTNGAAGTGSP
jgi:hypothetical protein